MSTSDACGWLGDALILLAYFLNSYGKIKVKSGTYLWLNFAGACLVGVNAVANRAVPIVALEVAWGVIALHGLMKAWRARVEVE